MNGTEQRTHRTVTDTLTKRIEEFSVVMESLAEGLKETAQRGQETRRDVNTLKAQQGHLDASVAAILPLVRGHDGRFLGVGDVSDDLATFKIEHAVTGRSLDALLDLIGRCESRIARFDSMNIWQRFYWLLTGR